MSRVDLFAYLAVGLAIALGWMRAMRRNPSRLTWGSRVEGGVSLGALLAFLVIPYCLARFGLNFTDAPWHIGNFPRYREFPMTALPYFLADRFTTFAGHELMTTRVLAVFLAQATISLPFLVLIRWRVHRVQASALLATLGFLHAATTSFTLGYDVFSNFFLMGVLVSGLAYVRTRRPGLLVLFGFCSGLAMLSRFPNVVVIFVGVLTLTGAQILEQDRRAGLARRLARDNGVYLLVAVTTFWLINLLLHGGFPDYRHALTSASDAKGHGFTAMAGQYVRSGLDLLLQSGAIASLAVILRAVYRAERLRRFRHLVCSVCFSLLFVYVLKMDDSYHYMLKNLLTGFVLVVLGLAVHDEIRSSTGNALTFQSMVILLFSLVPAVGSNTGLLKVSAIYLLPVVLFAAWNTMVEWKKTLVYVFFLAIVAYLPFSLVLRTYQDAGVLHTTARIDNEKLRHILTTPARAEFVRELVRHAEALRSKGIDFVLAGRPPAYLFEYLLNVDRLPFDSFVRNPEDPSYVSAVMQFLRDRRQTYVVLVPDYPDRARRSDPGGPGAPSALETALRDRGYSVWVEEGGYRIYQPQR